MLPSQRNAPLSIRRFIKFAQLAYFSTPSAERVLFQALKQTPASAILEIGLESVERTQRLIEAMQILHPQSPLRYVGVDLFEARPQNRTAISLKQTHQALAKFPNLQVRLIPGDTYHALARSANTLSGMDFVVISGQLDADELRKSWFYLPRMLHGTSRVYAEEPGPGKEREMVFRLLPAAEIQQRAEASRQAKRHAA